MQDKDWKPALILRTCKNILKSIWPIIAIAVFILIYFYKIIFLKKIYLIGDLYYYYFVRVLIANDIKSLILPLWTPYLNCGFPLMANPEAGVFDPLNLLFFYLFNPPAAFNLLICVYFFMAGLFTFFFCRSLSLDRVPSLFSAIVFIFGGAFSARLIHAPMIFSAAFLPLTLLAINLYFKNRHIKYIFLTGISMGLSFLPGHPQIAIYGIFYSGVYFIFKVFTGIGKDQKFKKFLIHLFLITIIFTIAFGIAAIQILPAAEFTQLSDRASRIAFKQARTISFYFSHFITYIFPYFFGKDQTVSEGSPYWGRGNLWEVFVYIGIFPLCFLFASFYRIRNDKRVRIFSSVLISSLLLALGKNSPVFFLAYHIILPFQYFMNPCRFIFISSFASAILGGLGLSFVLSGQIPLRKMIRILIASSLTILVIMLLFNCILYLNNVSLKFIRAFDLKNIHNQLVIILFASLITLLFLIKNKKINTKTLGFAVIAITFVDLFIVGYSHNIPIQTNIVTTLPGSVSFLKKDKDIFRVYNIGVDFPYGPQKHKEVYKIPFFAPWKIESAGLAGPLCFREYGFLRRLGERDGYLIVDSYLGKLGLLNAKYITSSLPLKSDILQLVFDDGRVKIYKNPKLEPRSFFINAQEVKSNVGNLDIKLLGDISELHQLPHDSKINIERHASNNVMVKVDTPFDGFLILRETAYPGWEVFVDEKEKKMVPVNITLRAVFLEKGEHSLKFIYRPKSVKIGGLITFFFCFIALPFLFTPLGSKKIKM